MYASCQGGWLNVVETEDHPLVSGQMPKVHGQNRTRFFPTEHTEYTEIHKPFDFEGSDPTDAPSED